MVCSIALDVLCREGTKIDPFRDEVFLHVEFVRARYDREGAVLLGNRTEGDPDPETLALRLEREIRGILMEGMNRLFDSRWLIDEHQKEGEEIFADE